MKFSPEFWVGSGLAVFLAIIALGTGLAMDARTKGEYWFVIACFCVSWFAAIITVGIWYFHSLMAVWTRSILGAAIIAIVSIGMFGALGWASARHERASAGENNPNGVLTSQVVTILLGPMFRFFQTPPVYFQRLDTSMRVILTNTVGRPLYLKDYSVEVLEGTEWIRFKNADSASHEPYAFGSMQAGGAGFIRRLDLTNNGFDYVMQHAPLNSNESRELWLFFMSGLTRDDLKSVTQVRFRFVDSTGEELKCTSPYSISKDKGAVIGTKSGDLLILPSEPIPPNLKEEPAR